MNIKKTIVVLASALAGFVVWGESLGQREDAIQALKGAVDKIGAAVKASKIADKDAVSFFFLKGDDDGYAESLLRNAFLTAGKTVVVPNNDEDEFLKEIYKQMAWDERKSTMLDPKTVEKIDTRKLKSTQVLVYGRVSVTVSNPRYALAEISLDAYSIQTKEYLFSKTVECRYYNGKYPRISVGDLPVAIRETMQNQLTEKIVKSIKSQPKLKALSGVACIQPDADEKVNLLDAYMSQIAVGALSKTNLKTMNLNLQTLGEAYRKLRDNPKEADGIFWCDVRAVQDNQISRSWNKSEHEIVVEVQAQIEKAATQEVLWSDTCLVKSRYTKSYSFFEWFLGKNPSDDPQIVIPFVEKIARYALFGIVALALLGVFIRKATRVR